MLVDIHGYFGSSTPAALVTRYAGVCGLDLVLVGNRDAASEPEGAVDLDEAAANLACLEACQSHARLVPLYWVRPGRADSNLHALAGALTTEPFVGLVLSPAENGYQITDQELDPYLAVLARTGKPGLIRVSGDERTAPPKVYELARRHPGVPLVLCGCGAAPERRAEALDVVRRAAQREDARLYLDTSHATADAISTAVHALGPARVLFGTNALSYEDAHVPRHIALLEELQQSLLPDEFHQVTGDNAAKLFGLRKPASA